LGNGAERKEWGRKKEERGREGEGKDGGGEKVMQLWGRLLR